ncbi:hypothetical protein BGZ79_010633, partial [Entomortierella chlamydospora]
MSNPMDTPIPTVLIVGAGLGGLMLGAILESANISYHILERATELRSLGSAIAMFGNILPAFEQLGIYEELKAVSLPHISSDFYDAKLNDLGSMSTKDHKIVCGYDILVTARPKLYDILRRKVPTHKISMRKKVLRAKEQDSKVTVYCSDNTIYECSILVGADGAYSAVRQSMYKELEKEGNLPLDDKEAFSIGYITMVGVSNPPSPEKYPQLIDNSRSYFRTVLGENSDSCYVVTAPDNQICWGIQIQIPENKAKEQHFRNSEWGPESVDATLEEFQDFPCAFGGTMKDIFDATSKNLISKVFLEEKVFQTWYHGRAVLIGDACHKLLPGAGQGAAMAMKDAVVLANCIHNMRDMSDKSIKTAFASYYRQRYLEADNLTKNSAIFTKIMFGHYRAVVRDMLFHKKEGRKDAERKRVQPRAMTEPTNDPSITVLIVGAGLGGLMLGAVLERTNISYHILERATELRPLGTAIGILGTILPIFEQLGIYEELKSISLPHVSMDFYDTQINQLGSMYTENHKTVSGYDVLVTARPKLYDLLLRQVPAHKISMRKKVLRASEEDNKVTVYCSDNSIYECSMLVGADGAYSAVRQNMYEKLEEEGNLPLRDKDGFSIGYITMVGVSNTPKPEKYPELIDNRTHFRVVVGEKSESCYVVSAPNNQLCWGFQLQLSEEKAREQCFRNSEWGPESVDAMLMEFQNFPCPFGGTMKDLFDATPKDLISKVFLEEKVFQTWYHGRSVLIGDACHKLLPGGGQGAVMAIKDAVVLANCIYNMKDGSDKSIKAAFASYHKQRYPEAENVSVQSAIITKVMFGH